MAGTDNIKKDIQFIADAIKQAEVSFKDGFQYTDLFAFVGVLSQVPGVIDSVKAVQAEVTDLDAAEIADLLTFISLTFKFQNAKLQQDIQNAIAVVFAVLAFVKGLKA